ncbi:MAG TPA: SET domain-containing protein-lysine N-methyltransferase [Gemmatimonadaceae bacterium]
MAIKKTKTKKKRPAKSVRSGTKSRRRAPKSPAGKAGPVNKWMELRQSSIHGLGAFALQDIPKGTRIIEYTGEHIDNVEADRRYDDDTMRNHHTFLFILTSKTCIDAAHDGNEARFINHSCNPNAEAVVGRKHIWIDALKKIPAGTEILYDYAYEDDDKYTEEDYRRYGCRCGAPKCRGTIVDTKRKLNL